MKLRYNLAEKLEALSASHPLELGILEALTLGITQSISQDYWKLFRQTGTTHLMVISGAHIGLVAGLTFTAIKYLWSCLGRISEWIPAVRVASVFGISTGVLYALLAGFGIPAERAVVAFIAVSLRYIYCLKLSVYQAWCIALLAVLLFEPHAVMQPGFYLSFLAVVILISINQRLSISSVKKAIILQLACLIGLMPFTLYWFSYGSINGFMANLLAIPWVSFVIIPLGLFILIFQHYFPITALMNLENLSIQGLIDYLKWVNQFEKINLEYQFSSFFSVVIILFALTLFLFVPIRSWRGILGFLMISAWLPLRSSSINPGEVNIDILDVGQGLAVVVKTQKHILIYDTGMKFFQGSDIGQLVLIPYLKHQHIQKIDKVVISHPDLDHRGGLESLQKGFFVKMLLVDHPKWYNQPAYDCHYFPAWKWDGVSFQFFPLQDELLGKNNHSCVLQISTAQDQILLTGDIERTAEARLVQHYGNKLVSSVLVVPHHGSKTSSSPRFLDAVQPRYAILSYGFDNRYHFPHAQAIETYAQKQISLFSTEACGYIRVILKKNKQLNVICSKSSLDYF